MKKERFGWKEFILGYIVCFIIDIIWIYFFL